MRLFRRGEAASTLDLLVAGLGNPGRDYARTRHSVGFMVCDELARRYGASWRSKFSADVAELRLDDRRLALLKPQTFMNESGRAVAAAVRFFKVPAESLLVVHDEVDLEPGRLQARAGGGLAGHNGLRSIAQHLKTQEFLRLRIGVGRPERGDRRPVADYVLSPFDEQFDVDALVATRRRRGRDGRAGGPRGRTAALQRLELVDGIVTAVSRSASHTMVKPNQEQHSPPERPGGRGRRPSRGDRQAPLARPARPEPAQSAPGAPDPRGAPRRAPRGRLHGGSGPDGRERDNARRRPAGAPVRHAPPPRPRSRRGGDRSSQSVRPAGRAPARTHGRRPGAGRAGRTRPENRNHEHRLGRRGRPARRLRFASSCLRNRTGRSSPFSSGGGRRRDEALGYVRLVDSHPHEKALAGTAVLDPERRLRHGSECVGVLLSPCVEASGRRREVRRTRRAAAASRCLRALRPRREPRRLVDD